MEDLFNVNPNVWDDGTTGNIETGIMQGMMDAPFSNAFGMLQELFPGGWFADAQQHFGLSDSEIAQSVKEASAFFHMDNPLFIHEYRNTGVFTNLPFTDKDDILVFNRDQMQNMGITEKDGFDLVMTHECAHRMLQGASYQLSAYHEELCCDFMSGVRAGLNDMDITQIENALADQPEGSVHPMGALRVEAIHDGQQYAEQFMAETGHAPTFDDCYEHFCNALAGSHSGADGYDDGDMKEYTQAEIDRHVAKAEREMRDAESRRDYYSNWIRKHGTDSVMVSADKGLRDAERDYEHAKAELSKWKYMHPDVKGFAETDRYTEDSDSFRPYSSEVSKAVSDVKHCESKVNSLYSEMQSIKAKYGTNSSEYKHIKSAYDRAQSDLKEAREDYKQAVQNAHRNGTL